MVMCEADEEKVVGFIRRARAALMAHGWQAPDLSVLGVMYAPECAATRGENPQLAALADEYRSPLASECGDGWDTMRAAVAQYLGANAEGKLPLHFRTFAHDETANWDLSDTPLKGVPVFGLYMIREGGDGYGTFLENIFCYRDPAGAPKDGYGQGPCEAYLNDVGSDLTFENGGEIGTEFARSEFDDPAKLDADPRFSERITEEIPFEELDLSKVEESDFAHWDKCNIVRDALLEAAAGAASETVEEYLRGNAHHPKILLTTEPAE